MKAPKKLAVTMAVVISMTPAIAAAQASGPLPIREEAPGLLSQAKISPAIARLTAFGEFPGAPIVSAEIRRQGSRLVYAFGFKYADREGIETVQIDAVTGQVCRIEYSVERNPNKYLAPTAPPELVSLVELSFESARDAASAAVEHAVVLRCNLRVEQSRTLYVFDLAVGDGRAREQTLVDANTGAVIGSGQPR